MSRLSRKNVDYFNMFNTGMEIAHRAALQLQASLGGGVIREKALKQVMDTEREGNAHVRRCLAAVDVAFVTPFDRSDIVVLVKKIDGLTDGVRAAAEQIYILQIRKADAYLLRLSENLVTACRMLLTVTGLLRQHKKNRGKIADSIMEVGRFMEAGSSIFMESMARLFAHETDAVKLVRQKDLYELMINALGRCGDIADTVEQILIAGT